jgi:hypothetical protein
MKPVIKRVCGIFGFVLLSMVIFLGDVTDSVAAQYPQYPFTDATYNGIFATFGYNPGNKGIRSGVSEGVGIRFRNFGMKISYIDNYEFDQDRIGLMPGYIGDMFGGRPSDWESLGNLRTAGQYGFDADYYHNINKIVSLYGGVGLYYGAYQNIRRNIGGGAGIIPIGYIDADGVRCHYSPAVEAGIHVNIPVSDGGYMLLGVGYHLVRGATFDIGIRF